MATFAAGFLVSLLLALSSPLTSSSPLEVTRPLLIPAGDGSYGSISDTFYAASVLSSTKDSSLDSAKTCSWVSKYTLESKSLEEASSLASLGALVCKDAPSAVKEAQGILTAGAKSATSAKDAYLALEGLAALKAKSWVQASEVKAVAKSAADFLESAISTEKGSTPLSLGYALKGIQALLSLGAIDKAKATDLLRNVASLFSQAVTGQGKLVHFEGLPEEGGPLPASSLIASGYIALASSLSSTLDVPKETVAGLGAYLATAGAPLSLFEAHVLFEALSALDSNQVVVPVLLTVPGYFSVSSGTPTPAVSVHTVLGKPVTGATVTLSSARLTLKGSSSSKSVAQGKELKLKGSSFALPSDVLGSSSSLGTYTLKIDVAPSNPLHVALSPETRVVTAAATVTVSPVTVSILDSDKGAPESEAKVELKEGAKLASLSATHLLKIKVSVSLTGPSGKAFAPHQAFLTLTHTSGVRHNLILKGSSADSSGTISTRLDLLESLEKLYYLSGVYSLSLTLGDTFMENGGLWPLGSIDIDLPDAPESAPKPPSPPKSLAQRFQPKSEIAHIFRKPEKRPPAPVSLLFSGLAALPLLIFLGGLAGLGVNLKALPASGAPFLAALGFHGGIAAILLLYFGFWIQVKLFTTLKILIILGLVTAVPGHYILSYLADRAAKVKTT